jgi:hypothetical protein
MVGPHFGEFCVICVKRYAVQVNGECRRALNADEAKKTRTQLTR